MNRLSIRLRIAFGLAIILLLALASALNALYQNQSVKYEAGEVAQSWIPAIENLGFMKDNLAEHYFAVGDRLTGRPTETAEAFAQRLKGIEQALEKNTEVYAATLLTYTDANKEQGDAEKALYADYRAKRDRYFKAAATGLAGIAASDPALQQQAQTTFSAEAPAAFRQAYLAMQAILKFNLDGTAGAAQQVASTVVGTERVMVVALVLTLLIGGVLIVYLPRSVSRPLDRAAQATERVAAGDLSRQTEVDGRDEVNTLIARLNAMQTSLAEVVGGVRHNAESVADASSEIAQGNHDLSARTESQASALEQTAASMQELSTTVQNNSESVRTANQLVIDASGVASQGGQVVTELVGAMREIHESSRRINDIIGTIDGIAFQTNILALNAAVEAARAGEQGRGFAVVAGEVRSLAQRSAGAAKEIKDLIGASVERIEQGNSLAQDAGETIDRVVQAITRVTGIFAEITQATSEQSLSVAQVGEAVRQMDQTTQQNAALVEEMAAAASALKGQAEDLVAGVARFTLPPGRLGAAG